jgi:hypothetical protein
MGRTTLVFLSDGTLNADAFRGTRALSHLSLFQNRSNEESSGGAKSNEVLIYVVLSTSSYVCKIAP